MMGFLQELREYSQVKNALNYSGKNRLSMELSIEDKTDTGQGDTYIIGIALI